MLKASQKNIAVDVSRRNNGPFVVWNIREAMGNAAQAKLRILATSRWGDVGLVVAAQFESVLDGQRFICFRAYRSDGPFSLDRFTPIAKPHHFDIRWRFFQVIWLLKFDLVNRVIYIDLVFSDRIFGLGAKAATKEFVCTFFRWHARLMGRHNHFWLKLENRQVLSIANFAAVEHTEGLLSDILRLVIAHNLF